MSAPSNPIPLELRALLSTLARIAERVERDLAATQHPVDHQGPEPRPEDGPPSARTAA